MLIKGEGLIKQRGSAWIGRGEGSSTMAILLRILLEEMRHQKLWNRYSNKINVFLKLQQYNITSIFIIVRINKHAEKKRKLTKVGHNSSY